MLYLTSPMHFWAKTNELIDLEVSSLYEQFIMQQGQEIEKIAEDYIKNRFDGQEIEIQPTYSTERFLARPDIVIKNPATGLHDIYEIKSSGSVKKEHKFDVTFQYLVCAECFPVGNSYIVHINKNFIKDGEIDFSKFFQIANVNEIVIELKSEVSQLMKDVWETSQFPTSNNIESCLKPTKCVSLDLCHPQLPEHPIYEISRIGKKARQLKDGGIIAIKDIPMDFPLTARQSIQVKAVKENKIQIDPDAIQKILNKLEYPIYFLDYETFNPAIPYFNGYSAYQHITFQFSLHTLTAEGQVIQHAEYLHSTFTDPTNRLASELKKHIGETGSVVVWNKSFEKGRNTNMAALDPDHADFMESINSRLFDLMDIFSKRYYVHPDFLGSASLKKILPVFLPDRSDLLYSGLTISNGEQAMLAWKDLINPDYSQDHKDLLKEDMLKYCELDTLAMVEILKKITEIIAA